MPHRVDGWKMQNYRDKGNTISLKVRYRNGDTVKWYWKGAYTEETDTERFYRNCRAVLDFSWRPAEEYTCNTIFILSHMSV